MAPWRFRDDLIVAGLVLSTLIVVVPIAAAYAGLVEVDVGTGLLTVVLAACVGFLALDSIPGRWFWGPLAATRPRTGRRTRSWSRR